MVTIPHKSKQYFNNKNLAKILKLLVLSILSISLILLLVNNYQQFLKFTPTKNKLSQVECLNAEGKIKSPQGTYILYTKEDDEENPTITNIILANKDCSDSNIIMVSPFGIALPFDPQWSQDENKIILSKGAGEGVSYYIYDLQNKHLVENIDKKLYTKILMYRSIEWLDNNTLKAQGVEYPNKSVLDLIVAYPSFELINMDAKPNIIDYK